MNKLERGLEMSLIAVVNLEERSAYALSMHQSVEQSTLKVAEEKLCSRSFNSSHVTSSLTATMHALDSSQRSSTKNLRSSRYYDVILRFDTSIKATTKGGRGPSSMQVA